MLVGILAAAFNLRVGILEVGPVIEDIRADTGMSSAAAGLLGTIPFLCMGVFAFVGVPLVRSLGARGVMTLSLILIGIWTALRAVMPTGALIVAATVPLGMGIALAGMAMPAVVKRFFPKRAGAATGAYVASLSLGGAIVALAVVPVAELVGGWRWAFAMSALPVALALPVWLLIPGEDVPPAARAAAALRRPPRLRSLAPPADGVRLALIFGFQSMAFASVVSWVAALYREAGWTPAEAALTTAVLGIVTVPAALIVPALSDGRDRRHWLVGTAALMTVGMMGLAFAPTTAPWLWLVSFSFGAGSIFPLALTLPLDLHESQADVARLTGWTLGLGYLVSGTGPVLVGALRDLTGGFTLAMALVGALGTLSGLLAMTSALRPRAARAGAARTELGAPRI